MAPIGRVEVEVAANTSAVPKKIRSALRDAGDAAEAEAERIGEQIGEGIERGLEDSGGLKPKVKPEVELGELDKLQSRLDRIDGLTIRSSFLPETGRLDKLLTDLTLFERDLLIGVDVDRKQVDTLARRLTELSGEKITPEVLIDADNVRRLSATLTQLEERISPKIAPVIDTSGLDELLERVDHLDGAKPEIRPEVDMAAVDAASNRMGNAFRGAFGRLFSGAGGLFGGLSNAARSFGSDAGGGFAQTFRIAAGNLLANLGSSLFSGLASAARSAVTGAIGGIRSAVLAASDLNESRSLSTVVFGDWSIDVQQQAQQAIASLGLTEDAYLSVANKIGVFAQAAGLAGQEQFKFTDDLVRRAVDLGSAYNLSAQEVQDAIASTLAGEQEAARKLGAVFSAEDVTKRLKDLGLAETEQNKVLARQQILLEKTNLIAGDFARTQDGLANRMRTFGAALQQSGVRLVDTFQRPLAATVGTLTDLLLPVTQLGEALVTRFVTPALTQRLAAFNEYLSQFKDNFQRAADAVKAGGSGRDALGAFFNVDASQAGAKLRQFLSDTVDRALGAGNPLARLFSFAIEPGQFDGLLDILGRLRAAFRPVVDLVRDFAAALGLEVGTGVGSMLNDPALPGRIDTLATKIQSVTDKIRDLLGLQRREGPDPEGLASDATGDGGLGDTAKKLLGAGGLVTAATQIGPALLGALPAVSGLATALGFLLTPAGLVAGAIGGIVAAGVYFYKKSPEFQDAIDKVRDGLESMADKVRSLVQPIIDTLVAKFTSPEFKRAVGDIADSFKEFGVKLDEFLGKEAVKQFFNDLADILGVVLDVLIAVAPWIAEAVSKVGEWLLLFTESQMDGFHQFVDVLRDAKTKFEELWPKVVEAKDKITEFAEKVKTAWEEDIKPKLDDLIAKFTFVKDTVVNFVETAKAKFDEFKTKFDEATGAISGFVTTVQGLLGGFAGFIAGVFETASGALGGWNISLSGAGAAIAGFVGGAIAKFGELLGNVLSVVSGIAGSLGSLPGTIAGLAGGVFNAALSVGRSIIDGLSSGLSAASGIAGDIASAVTAALKSSVNAVLGQVESGINGATSGLRVFGVGVPSISIPRLAQGGIIPATNGGQLALLAEAGRAEAAIPLGPGIEQQQLDLLRRAGLMDVAARALGAEGRGDVNIVQNIANPDPAATAHLSLRMLNEEFRLRAAGW